MYTEFFGLNEKPFTISPNPHYFYMSDGHREALAHLLYGIKGEGGFVLLTGEVGTGKTTVCRVLLELLPRTLDVAFLLNPPSTVEELLATLCDEFGISYTHGSTSVKIFVGLIQSYLLGLHAKGRRAILIVEEAQNLTTEVLEQIRLLTNLETNEHKLLQIIMIGQPELRDKLNRTDLRQLDQRITARYHLGPLGKKEIASYVTFRLSTAGLRRFQLFPARVTKKLLRLSAGIPRVINAICDRALLGAYVQGKDRIDIHTLSKAAREVFGDAGYRRRVWKIYRWRRVIRDVLYS
jgi:general secretion pathway protein A